MSGATFNSSPEKTLISPANTALTSSKTGVMIPSDRAFSLPTAIAQGIVRASVSRNQALGSRAKLSGRKRSPSTVRSPKACLA